MQHDGTQTGVWLERRGLGADHAVLAAIGDLGAAVVEGKRGVRLLCGRGGTGAQQRKREQQKQQALVWYMELAGLLREEGKEQSGHLEHTIHLIADLDNLHRQLLTLPAGENYRRLYGAVAPELPGLKSKLGKPGMSDVELFFRALYAVMLYRIKGDRSKQGYIDDVIGLISPVVAELATMFRRIERGEVDLFGDKKE